MNEKVLDAIRKKVEEEPYAQKLGLKLVELDCGYSVVEMEFRPEMENIFGMAHGGAIFSLIDEAFETSCNAHGTVALALNMTISYVKAAGPGETLRAQSKEVSRSSRIGTYDIRVTDSKGELIAVCQAMAYRKKDPLPFLD